MYRAFSPGRYGLGIVLLLAAMWVGLHLPDADLQLRLRHFFMHRSILTHSLLLPLFFFWPVLTTRKGTPQYDDPLPRYALMGLFIGLCVHFAFDLFPRGWGNFSRIHIPLYGWGSPLFSWLWLAGSLVAALYAGRWLLRSMGEFYLSFAVLAVAFVLASQTESTPATFSALIALAIAGLLALKLPCRDIHSAAPGG